jgi:hypothetical protein
MVYLVPMSYSILVICTYPIMHSLCNYLMVNQEIRRYEIVAILASIIGFFSLVQLDIVEIKRLFNESQSLYQTALDLQNKLDLVTFGLAIGLSGSLLRGLHLTMVHTLIEHVPYSTLALASSFMLLFLSLFLSCLLGFSTLPTTLPADPYPMIYLMISVALTSSVWSFTHGQALSDYDYS